MENEIWKDIIGYEGRYQISNKGNVKTLQRSVIGFDGKRHADVNEANLKQQLCGSGYLKVGLNNPFKQFMIHRLVAIYFVTNPDGKREVNHLDGNKLNNNDWNLKWVTPSENMRHCADNELRLYTKVLNTETGIYYNSITEGARAHGIPHITLWQNLYKTKVNKTSFIVV